jgi:hypothetical protein
MGGARVLLAPAQLFLGNGLPELVEGHGRRDLDEARQEFPTESVDACGVQKLDPAGKRAHSATSLASDELRMEGVRLGEK